MDCDELCIKGYMDYMSRGESAISDVISADGVHPAYLHGFTNAIYDKYGTTRKPAAELRADFEYIKAVFNDHV